jgi:protocatechuate 3,4-dioxygenase beta subunit
MFTAILLPLVTAAQLQQPAPPRDTAPSRRGSASIAGRVTEQGSGRPLARAIVTLTPNGGDSIRTETLTDADGRYEFNGIEPGSTASQPDLVSCERHIFGRRSASRRQ